MLLNIVLIIFLLLEISNVIILIKAPEFKYGNSMINFKHWNQVKEDEDLYLFTKYLINWVACTKLIFIIIMISVLLFGDFRIKAISTVAMVFAMGFYYFYLHPLISQLDQKNKLTINGYSKTLSTTIAVMIVVLILSLVISLILLNS